MPVALPKRLLLALATAATPVFAAETVEFSRDVLPILSANCFKCHGRDSSTREAHLRLDLRDHATALKNSGYTPIVPGKPEDSDVITRITSKDDDERMPPPDKGRALNVTEIETLRQWIAAGANYTEHWAYVPPKKAALPAVRDRAWARSPIDHFVLARLEAEQLKPAPRASRETLLRRATLDLIGLPPTPAEIEAFSADKSPDALAKVIDRLLASPHYGERYGRHWLDVARYADSGGFETDLFFGHAWRYRDYVIRAFNADKPFDRFIKEQIAGDELFPGNEEARIATGLYTTGPVLQEAGMVAGKLEYDQNTDFADTTGSAFLGLTVGCARCHDHKYDPISQKEYYSLQAIFAASDQFDFAADGTKIRDRAALKRTDVEFDAEVARNRAQREKDPVKRAALVRKVGDAFIAANPQLNATVATTKRYNLIARTVDAYKAVAAGRTPPADVDPLETDPDDNNDLIALKAQLLGLRSEIKTGAADIALFNVGVVTLLNPPQRTGGGRRPLNAAKDPAVAKAKSDTLSATADKIATALAEPAPAPIVRSDPRPPTDAKAGAVTLQQTGAALNGGGFGVRRAFAALNNPQEKRDFLLTLGQQQLEPVKPEGYVEDVDALRLETGEKHLGDPSPIPNRVLAHKEKVPEWHVLKRGELEMPGDVVAPGFPEKFAHGLTLEGVSPDRWRSGLAEWIASEQNLTTARVIVNRVWQWHFGEGLVRTPNDFGIRGDVPSHPALLDWLTVEFTEHGWSLKHLHRLIMNSAAYQMSATASAATIERDPENRLLTRFQPHRLEAEVVWDNLRAAAGTLDLTMFGLPIAPPLDEQEQLGNYRKWPASTPEEANRRAIYILVKRSFRFPMLSAFDLPDNISSCGRRDITTVPNQALTLLNNRSMRDQASAFAKRLIADTNGQLDAIPARAWLLAYGRSITPDERQQTLAFLRERSRGGDLKPALGELCLALFNTNEFIYQQ
jgi:hypothetical protein